MYVKKKGFWLHSLHSVGSAEKGHVIDLSEEYKFTYVPRWVYGEKRVFDGRSAHSKAVLDDSFITVDTTSLDQRASKEVTRVT